jgi:hypothetical protein
MRMIVHNWPSGFVQKILRQLREVATQDTKLLICDYVLPLACMSNEKDGGNDSDIIIEGESAAPPFPLLPNMGEANKLGYLMDCCVSVGDHKAIPEQGLNVCISDES